MTLLRKNTLGGLARRRASTRRWRREPGPRSTLAKVFPFLVIVLAPAIAFAQGGSPQAPHAATTTALRVCVDPGDMPFSDRAGQGFEDKLAVMVAKALGERAEFEWQRGPGLMRALHDHQCDVVAGWPTAEKAAVLTTRPYYRSTYVLIYRQSLPYRIRSLDDPALKTLSIGVRTIGDQWTGLPGGALLAAHGLQDSARPYPLHGNTSAISPSLDLIKAVADGDIDAAIAWGPPAAYFAKRQAVKIAVVPLTHTHLRIPVQFSISMAVRPDDVALRDRLDKFIRQHHASIHALLAGYYVPLLPLDAVAAQPSVAEQ